LLASGRRRSSEGGSYRDSWVTVVEGKSVAGSGEYSSDIAGTSKERGFYRSSGVIGRNVLDTEKTPSLGSAKKSVVRASEL